MVSRYLLSTLMVLLAVETANAADAQSIFETARSKQAERWATVDNYTVTLSVRDAGGLETPVYFEKVKVDGQATFRMVPPGVYSSEISAQAGFPPLSPEAMEEMARGYDMLGDAMATGGGDMPPMDIRGMTQEMSSTLRAWASYEPDDGKADAADAVRDMAEFAKRARLVGTEEVLATSDEPGLMRKAYHLMADKLSDIKLDQPEGDAKFTLDNVSLWIDTEHYVPLRLLMNGEVEVKGKKSPMTIEKLDLDYKQVGPLYESHQQVYKLSGMMAGMSDKEKKEMEEAKKQMDKAKKDLEKMPPEQRDMVMKMMGSQMEKLEKMLESDAITSITDVSSIAINEGPPTPYGLGDLTVGGPVAASYPGALTVAAEVDNRPELAIVARLPGKAQATIGLFGEGSFPESGELMIVGASGSVKIEGGSEVIIEKGSGTITVTVRTPTRIAGTYTALLSGMESTEAGDKRVDFSASGKFDSGAPVSTQQALRGSPIPADLLSPE